MDQALQTFSQKTDSVLGYLKTQLSSIGLWQNIPGTLSKISSSSAGYVWGIQNSGNPIWYCREPCASGSWTGVASPARAVTILDVATDASSVYVLFEATVDTPAPPPPPPTPAPPQPEMILNKKGMIDYRELAEAAGAGAELLSYVKSDRGGQLGFRNNPQTSTFFTRLIVGGDIKTQLDYAAWLNNPTAQILYNSYLSTPLPELPPYIQKDVNPLAFAKLLDYPTLFGVAGPINPNAAQRALLATNNDPQAAYQWLQNNANDPILNEDIPQTIAGPTPVAPEVPPPPPAPPAPSPYKWASRPIDGSGDWSVYDAPFKATSLANTNGFIWMSGEGRTAFCGKPCTTGNWNIQEQAYTIKGAGGSQVYASQPGQLGLKMTNETGQTGWAPVPGLEDTDVTTLAGEGDASVLYAADGRRVLRCEASTCSPVDTQGYLPLQSKGSLSVNPTTRNVWMVSGSTGTQGNVFARLDTPDTAPILDYVTQTDSERDRIVNSLGDAIQVQTAQQASRIAQKDAIEAVRRVTDISGQQDAIANEAEVLSRKVTTAKSASSGFTEKLRPLTILLVALVVTVVLYFTVGWFLPYSVMMILAFIVVGAGFGGAIYFSVKT